MTRQSVQSYLFSVHGRVSRFGLAIGMLLPLLVAIWVTDLLNSWFLTAAVWAFFAWPLFIATPWKRMHDTGRSGRWNVLFLLFYVLGFGFLLTEYVIVEGGWSALFDGAPPRTVDDDLTASGLGGFSTVLIFLPIHLFWLYLIPSQAGDNRYGPPPRPQE